LPKEDTAPPAAPPTADDDESGTWPERTPFGAAWRCAVVLVSTTVGMAVGAWLGSKLIQYDTRLVTGTTGPVTVIAGAMVVGWLRARNIWLFPTMFGSLMCAQAAAWLLHDGDASLHPLHLADVSRAPFGVTLLAIAATATLVGIIGGATAGHLNPRPLKAEKDENPGKGTEKAGVHESRATEGD
jgi:hypothetical protein